MNKKEIRHEQLSFSFDKEYPSLLEPLRQKENELGTSSTGSVFYRIQMINCYLEEGDFSNAFKCLEKVVKVIFDVNSKPSSNYFRELTGEIKRYLDKKNKEWVKNYPGSENLKVAVMGCVVNGPGESKAANIGISLPGSGENPVAPIYIDGEKVKLLSGSNIADDFIKLPISSL